MTIHQQIHFHCINIGVDEWCVDETTYLIKKWNWFSRIIKKKEENKNSIHRSYDVIVTFDASPVIRIMLDVT